MGRQAYLDKIAFGRSAFEPTQAASESTAYVQLESSQSEIPRQYHEATANNYIQLYDERGNPINPRSHQYGKKLRGAQNDVLAAVGVVERRRSPAEGLPGSSEDRLELLEAEDTVGNAIALATTLTENLCTWWIGAIRERILTFHYPRVLSFTQIAASERSISGPSILYAGFAPCVFATTSMKAAVYSTLVYQPVERVLHATRASAKTRNLFRRARSFLKSSLRLGLEIICYPFFYHAALQRMGLVPARPLLPSWRTLVPFAKSWPLLPFSLHYDASNSMVDCIRAALTSPVVLLCLEHSIERWISACVYEAVESSIIRPDKPDIASRDANGKDRALAGLGLRRESPPLIRTAIQKMLVMLGWASPLVPQSTGRQQSVELAPALNPAEGQTIDIGGTRVTNATPLNLPVVQSQDLPVREPMDAVEELMRSTTPPASTTGSEQDENDPRIRITSREGIVEMEVRLPPRTLSTHTEVAEAFGASRDGRASEARSQARLSEHAPYHRVTQLSCEPAQMISAMVRAQLVGLAMLPVRLVTLRMIASHYLASQGRLAGPLRIVSSLDLSTDLSWHDMSTQFSRVALCGGLEMTIDLGLWGLQYLAITKFGRRLFGWGAL
ncbi:small nucleolar ribonucleoprotein complex subunit [Stemphylium lycopersici]|uniref:Small nucleolar ribonucleoprotein complex subunit n=1 Tax=Stemphylium lycopersici TaxID=183478 RepID=A0A364N3K3_STELY|nr:small nucleolar ribonucleoprotein complex subunit [Stemphylium lycopersici]RAR11092.1 small nucleolar ribonucleoprotein complex subunit [Stemphylium lycopersici]